MIGRLLAWLAGPRGAPALILAPAAVLLGHALAAGALHPLDDCNYATLARNIVETGEWLPLRYDGAPFYNHGPLVPWLTALSFHAFGIHEAAARLPSILFGVGCVALAYAAARRAGEGAGDEGSGPFAGALAGIVLLATEPFLRFSGRARFDAPLAFFFLLAAWGVARGLAGKRRAYVVAGAAAGLAVSVKGVAGAVPLAAALLAIVAARAWRELRSGWLWLGVLTAVALPLPWMLYLVATDPQGYWHGYLAGRWLEVLREGSAMPPQDAGVYVRALALNYWPWIPVVLVALARAARDVVRRAPHPALPYAVSALCTLFAISALRTKYDHYLLPVFPAFAVLCGAELVRWIRGAWRRRVVAGCAVLAIAAIGAFLALPVRMHHSALGEAFRAVGPEISDRLPPGERLQHVGLERWQVIAGVGFYGGRLVQRDGIAPDAAATYLAARRLPVLVAAEALAAPGAAALREGGRICAGHGALRLVCPR
jgi:4-amino-4-deoxy-L-arabinose transferase-like glycosyltransferase